MQCNNRVLIALTREKRDIFDNAKNASKFTALVVSVVWLELFLLMFYRHDLAGGKTFVVAKHAV